MVIPALNSLWVPDLWQQEAVRHLRAGRDVIVDAPTGAGKTYVFENVVESRAFKGQAVYTVPTRALANDKWREWRRKKWNVGIATGEVAENPGAPVLVATLETQRDRLLEGRGPALLVIDEYQMLADPARGRSYELALAVAPLSTQLLLLSGSVANPGEVRQWLRRLGRECEVVSTKIRPVPLDEMPVESLPRKAPSQITGFWPRLAVEVLLAQLGPLLLFAPRRSQAEKIARQIAAALPADDPLRLTEAQQRACGRELSAVLEKRVAWHHSGLGYQARAGVVEPLAKAGKLRVVVATTGLAAGINFSMRSVLVSETRFFDGTQERELRRDELLQMAGRAGRRGLDDQGTLIVTRHSPRLSDAAPLRLRPGHGPDWPPLLRVMHLAAERGESPIAAAERLNRSFFPEQVADLGFGPAASGKDAPGSAPTPPAAAAPPREHSWFGLGPSRREIRNSQGAWEGYNSGRAGSGPLAAASVWRAGRLQPALECADFVGKFFHVGRVCRLERNKDVTGENGQSEGAVRYGRELAIGLRAEGRRQYVLTKQVRRWLGEKHEVTYHQDHLASEIIERLRPHFEGGAPAGLHPAGDLLMLRLDFAHTTAPLYQDSHGVWLAAAEERFVSTTDEPEAAPGVLLLPNKETEVRDDSQAPPPLVFRPGSPAAIWRRLGLIDASGVPTRRGVIVSFFHQGEGLAVAAGLEEATLPVEELALLLANLRAGARFAESLDTSADRLALACRQCYGAHDVEGYLSLGLPPAYGQGASEIIAQFLAGDRRVPLGEFLGAGDVERVFIEWLSLLRHIAAAPAHAWEKWMALKALAAATVREQEARAPARQLPDLPARQLVHQPDLSLSYARLRARA